MIVVFVVFSLVFDVALIHGDVKFAPLLLVDCGVWVASSVC